MEILDNEIDLHISPEEYEWEAFIGNNAAYYIPIWHKFQKQGTKVHFHLPALFLNIYWLTYRKMYKYAIAYVLFSQVLMFFVLFFMGNDGYVQIQFMLFFFYPIFGLFSNWLYYDYAQKTIAAIKRTHKDEASQQKAIQEAGQTNISAPFIFIFVSGSISVFVPWALSLFY